MSELYWLSQIKATEKSLVGDKAFFLSQLLQHNCPVVSGFAVSNSVFQEFLSDLEKSQSLVSSLSRSSLPINRASYQTLQLAANKSRRIILEATFRQTLQAKIFETAQKLNSTHLIIRPSLTLPNYQQQGSFGLLKSRVCLCHPEAIATAIKQVWADLFSAKSLLYWHKLNFSIAQVGLAILVQPLQDAIASGTVELINKSKLPHSKITDSLSNLQGYIIANWGLGHSIQRGEVEPDRYLVDLPTGNIVNHQIGLKTTAYRLSQNYSETGSEDLESYLVADSDQEKIVLKPDRVAKLTQLVANIIQHEPQISYFEWVLSKSKDRHTAKNFSFTQLGYLTSAVDYGISASSISSSDKSLLLRGVAAAASKVTAPVYNYHDSKNHSLQTAGAILVTDKIQPQDIHLVQNVRGIITETGGQNSHGAILARELGIPAVVAATDAVEILKTGDWITLDGDLGTVHPASALSSNPQTLNPQSDRNIVQYYAHAATQNVPLATQLMINLSQPNLIEQAIELPVDGVGLLRGEFMISNLLSERSLEEWLQSDYQEQLLHHLSANLRNFVVKFAPKPIYYRSLDFPLANKKQNNSIISNRGTFAYLTNSLYFQIELAAIKRVLMNEPSNFRLILPFVRSLQEWQFCYDLVQQAGLMNYPNFQLWMMAEVPSVIFLLPEYIAAGVQGIAIGMNDLTQLILGVDREQDDFAKQGLNSSSKAVELAIAQLVTTAKNYNLPCSICLSANQQNSDLINKLVNWGITIISVESQTVIDTYDAIARAEKRLLLQNYLD